MSATISQTAISPEYSFKLDRFEEKYFCKRCNGKLKRSTYIKYGGYSSQCLRKIKSKKSNEIQRDLTPDETRYYLSKSKVTPIKIYSFDEYIFIYAIKYDQKYYYNRYLNRFSQSLLNLPIEKL